MPLGSRSGVEAPAFPKTRSIQSAMASQAGALRVCLPCASAPVIQRGGGDPDINDFASS